MTITIFKDKDCKGASKVLSGNIADLKDKTYDKPSSVRMDDPNDAVLLFKNDDWHGAVMYLCGKKTVTDLGDGKNGGQSGFGNAVRSVRITPFRLDINVTVVTKRGDMPGDWADRDHAEIQVRKVVALANAFYADRKALLALNIARISFIDMPDKFVLGRREGVPASWTNSGEVDVVFIDRFEDTDDNVAGLGSLPWRGKTVLISARPDNGVGDRPIGEMVYILLHEFGHYLGLSHKTAGCDDNLMWPSLVGSYSEKELDPEQIEEMHQKLARNISRKGDRN